MNQSFINVAQGFVGGPKMPLNKYLGLVRSLGPQFAQGTTSSMQNACLTFGHKENLPPELFPFIVRQMAAAHLTGKFQHPLARPEVDIKVWDNVEVVAAAVHDSGAATRGMLYRPMTQDEIDSNPLNAVLDKTKLELPLPIRGGMLVKPDGREFAVTGTAVYPGGNNLDGRGGVAWFGCYQTKFEDRSSAPIIPSLTIQLFKIDSSSQAGHFTKTMFAGSLSLEKTPMIALMAMGFDAVAINGIDISRVV